MGYELPQPGRWCTQCGARQGIAGPAWICRVCVAGGPHKRIVKNPNRRPLPPGTPLARERYRAAGLCVQCGDKRDRPNRLTCAKCRRRLADAQLRARRAHPDRTVAADAAQRAHRTARRRQWIAAKLCADCGGERDRTDRRLCAKCRRRSADVTGRFRRAHPARTAAANVVHRAYLAARRARLIAAGLCADCGADRDRADRKLCAGCRRRGANRTRAHRRRRAAQQAVR